MDRLDCIDRAVLVSNAMAFMGRYFEVTGLIAYAGIDDFEFHKACVLMKINEELAFKRQKSVDDGRIERFKLPGFRSLRDGRNASGGDGALP